MPSETAKPLTIGLSVAQRKKGARPRAERRERLRTMRNDTDRLERLAGELPGGSAHRPFSVPSVSVIPVRSRALRCLMCDGEFEPQDDDVADVIGGRVLRRVSLSCRVCHAARTVWFRIDAPLPS